MPAFTSTWDDFTGGYFVGENDNRQPRSTFTGENVAVSLNDGSVVATNKVQQIPLNAPGEHDTGIVIQNDSLYIDGGASVNTFVTPAVQGGDYIYFAVQFIGTSTTTFKMYRLRWGNPSDPTQNCEINSSDAVSLTNTYTITNVFTTNESGQIYAYVGSKDKIYRFTGTGNWDAINPAAMTTITLPSGITSVDGITVWNARMVAWSSTTDYVYYSEALNFSSWLTLNFIAPGYSNNGVTWVIPRYDDLLVVKPNAIYSITGVLGATAAVRQVSDAVYPLNTDYSSIVSQSNTMFYLSRLTEPYYANVNYLSGQQVGVAAYQNLGRAFVSPYANIDHVTPPSLAASSNGDVVCTYSVSEFGAGGFYALIRNRFGDWLRIKSESLNFYSAPIEGVSQNDKFIRRYSAVNNYQTPSAVFGFPPNAMVFMQVASNITTSGFGAEAFARYKSISFGVWFQQQVNAGHDYAGDDDITFDALTEGTLILSPVDDQKASTIRRIYVEATLDLDYINYGDFSGDAEMTVTVINGAPEDVAYDPNLNFVSSDRVFSQALSSIPNTTAFTPAEVKTAPYANANPYKRVTATRILRFDSDNMGYGYKHNVSIKFSGFRIKRVWIEGDSR
jgi:hypothetical protein